MLFYSGDTDGVVGTDGSLGWLRNLGWKVDEEWNQWYYQGVTPPQVAGYTFAMSNLRFTTINGCGHMVPLWKRGQALQMVNNFLAGKKL